MFFFLAGAGFSASCFINDLVTKCLASLPGSCAGDGFGSFREEAEALLPPEDDAIFIVFSSYSIHWSCPLSELSKCTNI